MRSYATPRAHKGALERAAVRAKETTAAAPSPTAPSRAHVYQPGNWHLSALPGGELAKDYRARLAEHYGGRVPSRLL